MVRPAMLADAAAVAAIYGHHVLNGVASFDTVPLDASAMCDRIEDCRRAAWPFLVADDGDGIAGYAFATQMRPRPAYAHTAENSIYVRPDRLGQGIGRSLLTHLVEAAALAGFRQMIAVVGGPEPASIALHEALGFRQVGRPTAVGFKFGRWLDTVYLQRALGEESPS